MASHKSNGSSGNAKPGVIEDARQVVWAYLASAISKSTQFFGNRRHGLKEFRSMTKHFRGISVYILMLALLVALLSTGAAQVTNAQNAQPLTMQNVIPAYSNGRGSPPIMGWSSW